MCMSLEELEVCVNFCTNNRLLLAMTGTVRNIRNHMVPYITYQLTLHWYEGIMGWLYSLFIKAHTFVFIRNSKFIFGNNSSSSQWVSTADFTF